MYLRILDRDVLHIYLLCRRVGSVKWGPQHPGSLGVKGSLVLHYLYSGLRFWDTTSTKRILLLVPSKSTDILEYLYTFRSYTPGSLTVRYMVYHRRRHLKVHSRVQTNTLTTQTFSHRSHSQTEKRLTGLGKPKLIRNFLAGRVNNRRSSISLPL